VSGAIYVGLGILAIVLGGGFILAIRGWGRLGVQLDQAERSIDAAQLRIEVDEENRGRSDDELRDRLRRKPS